MTPKFSYKLQCIKAAKNLLYSDEIIEQLEEAQTDEELSRIMKTARMERVDYESSIDSHLNHIF